LGIKLGSVAGIPLYLDYSAFIIFALIAYEVGFLIYSNLSFVVELTIGIVSAILVFVSIIVHELAHSIVAKRNGLKIGRITMYLLGGVSEMEEEPPTANLELKMSAAGPLTSLAIGAICFLGWTASVDLSAPLLVQIPLYYSFFLNVIVAAFNLIPAFPMDGGRMLRSLIWRTNGDVMRSTRIASTVGRVFAYLMVFTGIFFIISGDFFDGLWLILIGWFISTAASSEMNQMIIQRDLGGLKARDLMTRNVDSVTPEITLTELSSQFFERKHNGFPVIGVGGEIVGCVTMDDLRRVKRSLWDTTFVRDIMTPREKLVTAEEGDSAQQVLKLLTKNRIGRIFVLDESEQLSGIITRSDIMKTIQMQENIMGGSKGHELGSGREHFISVEKGMMFIIDSPAGGSIGWSALFNGNEFALVSETVVQLSGNGQITRFTFEALQKGRFSIVLRPRTASGGTGPQFEGRESTKYSIMVS
jgi:Zn-dependent protease/CBS domain-containing protein